MVDAGVADVAVLRDSQRVGRTNDRGRLLVTNLRAFERSRLSLETDTMPFDAVIARPDLSVRPVGFGGVNVSFAVDRMAGSALVHLVDEAGVDLAVGATIVAEDGGETVVGYDGLVMLAGLGRLNRYEVRAPGGDCTVSFAVEGPSDGLRRIGSLTCRRPVRYTATTAKAAK